MMLLLAHAIAAEPARLTFDTACGTTTVLYDGGPALSFDENTAEYVVLTEDGEPGRLTMSSNPGHELEEYDWIITYYSADEITTIIVPTNDPIEPATTVPFEGERFSEVGSYTSADCSSEGEGINVSFEPGTAGPSLDDRFTESVMFAAEAYESRFGSSVTEPAGLRGQLDKTLEECGPLGHLGGAYGEGTFSGTDDDFAEVSGTYDGRNHTIELLIEGLGTFSGTLDGQREFIAVGPNGLIYSGVYRRRKGRRGTWYAHSVVCSTSHT